MIITKKKFEEEIAKVRAEERARFEKYEEEHNEKRWVDERMRDLDNRMSNAFEDINRRLTELEKRPTAHPNEQLCFRY